MSRECSTLRRGRRLPRGDASIRGSLRRCSLPSVLSGFVIALPLPPASIAISPVPSRLEMADANSRANQARSLPMMPSREVKFDL